LIVAQIFNLPYRGFSIRKHLKQLRTAGFSTPCRLEVGDTAD
jgi:hypothetical protein